MNEKEKIWDINLVVEDIKKFPQTYKTILGKLESDGTCQTILRRKLNKLHKDGTICKTSIPGTRFGKCIYYIFPKKYNILVQADRVLGSKVYVFFKYEKLGSSKMYIRLEKYWMLEKGVWKKGEDEEIIFEGNVLRFI